MMSSPINISSEEFSVRKGKGYVDVATSSSMSATSVRSGSTTASGGGNRTGGGSVSSSSHLADRSVQSKGNVVPINAIEEGAGLNLPVRPGYDWVGFPVKQYFTQYRSGETVGSFAESVNVLEEDIEDNVISFRACKENENVCHGQEGMKEDFFYVYACLFKDLHIRLPFDAFIAGVLTELNVAPTQLHPNSWAALQAFRILCKGLAITPTPALFLHHFSTRPTKRVGWLSLISNSWSSLFGLFSSSYKNFKGKFFKVMIKDEGRKYFFNGDKAKFPLYWTCRPTKFTSWPRSVMSPEEVSALNTLNRLPRKLPTRKLLKAYKSPRLREELYDIMTSMNPNSKAYFKQMFQKFVPPSAEKAEESPVVVITEAIPIQQVFAASSGLSPRDGKKRKEDKSSRRHHDHGKKLSSPKRVSGETSAPLGGGIFGVELRLGNKLSFDLNGAEKEFYKGLSFGEAVEAIMELNARAALLCRTLCLDGEKVHSELADSRHELGEALKANSILNAQVKEAVSAHAACAETKTVLSSEIDSLKVEEKRLKDEVLRLQRSVDDHTLGRQRDKEERDELVKELEDAQRFVFEQHQLGFQKALNQAKFFYDIPLNEGNFDVGKDFYKGKLIPIAEIVDDDATQLVQPVKVEGATY